MLAGTDPQHILEAARSLVSRGRTWQHTLGDGRTSRRIVDHMVSLRDEILENDPLPPYVDRRKKIRLQREL